jgi:RNA polymerase sigma-70 factor (ECF subfamily)
VNGDDPERGGSDPSMTGAETIEASTGAGPEHGTRPGRSRQEATAALVQRYVKRVYRFLCVMLGDDEMAREATQETFLKISTVVEQGREDPATMSAGYVFATARNTAISGWRRRAAERRHLQSVPPEDVASFADPAGESDPARRLERSELRAALDHALAALPEKLLTVFLLSEIERLSYADIARVIDCPAGTVASRKHHAIRTLRHELRRQGFEL